jgi:Fe(3+) dicitrate transport protein
MMQRKLIGLFVTVISALATFAQETAATHSGKVSDTSIKFNYLKEITVVGRGSRSDIQQLPEIVGTNIYAGKKNALIVMDNVQGNVVTNNMRQVFAKVPGIHVWESDGSGIQIGVAARGLSPNRSWEFNVRQNGYDISSDPFGYPEAYYNPQLQGVQRIQIVRGAGALQYGPQFGGMINYILRNGSEINKPFEFETQQTAGSFGLFNSYNAVGGETKKLHYYAFFDHRHADGWRDNSEYKVNNGYITLAYKLTEKLKLGIEYNTHYMLSQQPGGLVDKNLADKAENSSRSRNWMNIVWNTAAINADYVINQKSFLNVKLFGIHGDRNSIGFIRAINIPDTIVTATGQYNPRTIDIDRYRNFGAEARYLTDYTIGKMANTVSVGLRYYSGNTERLKNGKGDTGSDFNTDLQEGSYPQDLTLDSRNTAAFAENVFRITKKFIIIPGIRFENITAEADGRLAYNADGSEQKITREKRTRSFVLPGVAAEFHTSPSTEFYANYTQAYRPMLFSDLTASPTTDVIDPDLEDAKGYNVDLGYRGKLGSYLFFDVSGYYLVYNNRIGTIAQQKQDGTFYNLRTNVGKSTSKGFEGLVEFDPVRAINPSSSWGFVSVFASYSYTDARYEDFRVVSKSGNTLTETNLKDKKVENAPEHIARAGITYTYKGLSLTYQLNHVSDAFSDANNTVEPNAAATNGLIPAYTVSDISLNLKFANRFNIRAGVNNVGDARYFTRRAGGYPGPGLLPADARSAFISVGAKL